MTRRKECVLHTCRITKFQFSASLFRPVVTSRHTYTVSDPDKFFVLFSWWISYPLQATFSHYTHLTHSNRHDFASDLLSSSNFPHFHQSSPHNPSPYHPIKANPQGITIFSIFTHPLLTASLPSITLSSLCRHQEDTLLFVRYSCLFCMEGRQTYIVILLCHYVMSKKNNTSLT